MLPIFYSKTSVNGDLYVTVTFLVSENVMGKIHYHIYIMGILTNGHNLGMYSVSEIEKC